MSPTLQRCDRITRVMMLPYWHASLAHWILRFDVGYAMWTRIPSPTLGDNLAMCARLAYSFALDILDAREE